MFHIVLVEPEIPPNTGNVIRLAANTGCTLHLDRTAGFLHGRPAHAPRGAGLPRVRPGAAACELGGVFSRTNRRTRARLFALTTRGTRTVHEVDFHNGDWLVFGAETRGLAPELRETLAPAQQLRLPMRAGQRSLNLSNAVAVTVFEAWRQNGFA
jgi:tRNA (cytidine/uridine-2'-O-)-methyltransferase